MKTGSFCRQRRKARAKEVFMRKKRLWEKFVKILLMKIFLIREKGVFSAHAKLSDKEKLFKHTKTPTSHRTQTNVQQSFSNTACHCELAVQQPISEISQSCVSSTASLSHRFKSSPAISGKFAIPGAAGYLMNAGHFRQNLESSGDLNRRSQDGVPCAFWLLFAQCKKWQSVLFAENIEVLQTSNQLAAKAASHWQN